MRHRTDKPLVGEKVRSLPGSRRPAGCGSVSLHPVTTWCGLSDWGCGCSLCWHGRRLFRLRHDVCAERGRPGRQEQEREHSGASTRPAARPESVDLLDLVGGLGVRFLTNQGGSVSYRAPGHLTTVRLDLHQAQKPQVGAADRETPSLPSWLRPWPY